MIEHMDHTNDQQNLSRDKKPLRELIAVELHNSHQITQPHDANRTNNIFNPIRFSASNWMDIIGDGDEVHNDVFPSRCFIRLMCLPENQVLSVQSIRGGDRRSRWSGMCGVWGGVVVVVEYCIRRKRDCGVRRDGCGVSWLVFWKILATSGNLGVGMKGFTRYRSFLTCPRGDVRVPASKSKS